MKTLQGKKILVVEDEIQISELLTAFLENLGASVWQVSNTTDAFQIFQSQNFDAIFTDHKMPGGNGLEFLERVHSFRHRMPLLFLCSGYTGTDLVKDKDLDIAYIFSKPFLFSEMRKILTSLLGETQESTLI